MDVKRITFAEALGGFGYLVTQDMARLRRVFDSIH